MDVFFLIKTLQARRDFVNIVERTVHTERTYLRVSIKQYANELHVVVFGRIGAYPMIQ